MVDQSAKRVLSCVIWSVILAALISGGEGLKINELRVPAVIQNGSKPSVILDCDYSFEDDPRDGLVIKWFFNNNPTPVYQWIPKQKPQDLGVLTGKLNLEYRASEEEHSMHRALQIINPTTELSGEYRCTVSTFDGEESQAKKMVVFVPPEKKIEVTQTKQNENTAVNITCSAEGVFPEPKLSILNEEGSKLENVETKTTERNGLFDIVASIAIEDEDLESPTTFDCELQIPEANYTMRAASSIYYPGPPSNTTEPPTTEANMDVDSNNACTHAVLSSVLLPLLALRL